MTSFIENLTLENPYVKVMIVNNARIDKNIIYFNNQNVNLFLPTMYKCYYSKSEISHIKFDIDNTLNDIDNNDILYIFDTWGISSYYHLLIDHIIPVWITKNIIEKKLNITEKNKNYFLRISNNNYNTELESSNEIFKYFLNDNYLENINNKKFKYIIYGYAYTYRPYHGPEFPIIFFNNYQIMVDKFINKFQNNRICDNKTIIIAKRKTRNNSIIEIIYEKINKNYNVMYIDFSDYSIEEQINICSSSYIMIGMEGASFANQIFMPKNSCLICICNLPQLQNIHFHSTLSKYLNHEFNIISTDNSEYLILDKIINIVSKVTP